MRYRNAPDFMAKPCCVILLVSSLGAFLLSSRLRAIIAEPISQLAVLRARYRRPGTTAFERRSFPEMNWARWPTASTRCWPASSPRTANSERRCWPKRRRCRVSQEIRDSLRTTLASIGDAVISTDARGRVVFVNAIAQSLLRLQEADLVGRHLDEVFQIVNEFSRATVESPVAQVLRQGTIVGMANHTILIAKDGTEIPIDDSGAPIRDESGAIQGTVLVFRDVTARRRAEETSNLLASIVQSSDDAIFSKDLNGVVTSWNSGAERTFGYSAEEMIGRSISTIFPPDRPDELAGIMQRIGREGTDRALSDHPADKKRRTSERLA